MDFRTIHTHAGLIAMAEATAAGTPINLTEMAVGDGNGNPVEPEEAQSQLARERFRGPVNRVYQDPDEPRRFTAELVIPSDEGGWTLREVGIFDENGTLFAVGNLPEAYKPAEGEGAFSDAVVRMEFMVSNADVVTLQVDPNVSVASQAWIINNINAASLIPGGTVGQLLGKATNADGDVEWQDPGELNVTVDTVAEKQTLADGQTQVDLSVTTTYGLAVYIEGLRIDMGSAAEEWEPDEQTSTRLHLGQAYPAGSRITLVNNEPAGSAPAPLERNRNLGDLQSASAARQNLDVFSRAQTRQMAPPGMVAHFARTSAPTGWLKANGAAVSRSAYAELFAAIGTTFGAGDGFSTFNLPDLRGEFLRGWDDSRGVDGGRELGSGQSDENKSHSHSASSGSAGSHSHSGSANSAGTHNHSASTGSAGSHSHSGSASSAGGHSHSASTNSAGSHSHGMRGRGKDGTTYGTPDLAGRGGTTSIAAGSGNPTAILSAGAHSHSVSISSAGAHTHSLSIKSSGSHSHPVSIGNGGAHTHSLSINSSGSHSHSVTVGESGGSESRPRNIALLACIKF